VNLCTCVFVCVPQQKLKLLVYSGDVDAIVPVTGTMTWMTALNRTIVTPKAAWYVNGQVGGRVTQYDGFTFTTIRNAGHMVPYTQPDRALHMVTKWIHGEPF
jgi:serine carboxypeptidase-like clade 2